MRECGTEEFNTNVFKKVKLSMSEEEIKFEEDKVRKLATFLKDQAITQLIKGLQRNEGVPTDSGSLSDFFHQNGVNMRYLGYIADQIKDKNNHNQMKYMLEREVVIRSFKHILNKYIRECESDELISSVIAHLLNCLLAPKDFIKKLDDGTVKCEPKTLEETAMETLNLLGDLDKLENSEGQEKQKMSKREKLRQKKAKQNENQENEEVEESEQIVEKDGKKMNKKGKSADIEDLLFKSQFEDIVFDAAQIFQDKAISMSVCSSKKNDVFKITPKKLYAEIK